MTELSDYRRLVEGPQNEAYEMRIASLSQRAEAAEAELAALRAQGEPVAVKALEWSEPSGPNGKEFCYDHVTANSSIGRYSIEWKGWKDYDDRTVFLAGEWIANGGSNLDLAKAAAQTHYENTIRSALVPAPTEAKADVGALEQSGFLYFECPECGFDSVQKSDFAGSRECPMCAGDSGHDVGMSVRIARSADKPEGKDARAALNLDSQKDGAK